MASLPIPHTPTSTAFPPTPSLSPATPPRRQSPTKRSHSSPSPNSSPNPSGLAVERTAEERTSLRVTRTKFMSDETADGSGGSEAWLAPETPPSPAEEDLLRGLGVEVIGEGSGVGEEEGGSGPEDQTRKLMEMPAALSSALSRLSSQHHLSEYNALKRVVAAAAVAAANAPPPPPVYTHLLPPPSRPVVQRSQSTPPLTLARPQHPLPANPNIQPPISHSRILRPSTPIPIPGRTDCTGTQSVPSLSRTSTPPASPRPTTTLTPSLIRMGIDSAISTPPLRPVELAGEVKENRLAEALTEALKSEMARPVVRHGEEAVLPVVKAASAPTVGANGLLPGMRMINGVAVKTSASHPMNISAVVPPEFLFLLSSHHLSSFSPEYPLLSTALDSHLSHKPFVLSSAQNFDLWDIIATPPSHPLVPPPPPVAGPEPALGNFFLSSCPGKKVRMDGVPVRGGRSAICRDVGMDLARAKQEGVRVVICCLNNEELSFLGAPWEEYSAAAASLSLAVIRIPMIEGYAPHSPAALDVHLTRVLRAHTLKGEAVLAHCRGGIGRAGLVACCWMIKIGFVRASEGEGVVEAMKVVERVIDVIRRRRSVKAIETPHQVAFLLEYVDFLQQNASVLSSAVDVA